MTARLPISPLIRSALALLALVFALTGCQTPTSPSAPAGTNAQPRPEVILKEGDVIRVSFPNAPPSLNTGPQQIRPDGKISVPLIEEEVIAAGKTPAQLEKELVERISGQLLSREVIVTVESAAFVVYVNGAVLRQGKVTSNRPLTALEAVMEAGFDPAKANLKKVKITRQEGGRFKQHTIDLKSALEGNAGEPFYLKPSDIVFVPEKLVLW